MPLHKEIELLKERMIPKVRAALEAMNSDRILKAFGVESVAVSETLRDLDVQMAYFSRGRMQAAGDIQAMYKAAGLYPISPTDAIKKITWTLSSKHLVGEAVDISPVKNGVIWWGAPEGAWLRMGELGEANGLTWGGRWKNKDNPHWELPN